MQSEEIFKKILVPMDRLIDVAQQMSLFIAEKFHSEVTLLRVVSPRSIDPKLVEMYAGTSGSKHLEREHEQARAHADPAEAIIEEAERGGYQLIIMNQSGAKEKNPHLRAALYKLI
jgi:nucleotide-binding universal stress UspA family protein